MSNNMSPINVCSQAPHSSRKLLLNGKHVRHNTFAHDSTRSRTKLEPGLSGSWLGTATTSSSYLELSRAKSQRPHSRTKTGKSQDFKLTKTGSVERAWNKLFETPASSATTSVSQYKCRQDLATLARYQEDLVEPMTEPVDNIWNRLFETCDSFREKHLSHHSKPDLEDSKMSSSISSQSLTRPTKRPESRRVSRSLFKYQPDSEPESACGKRQEQMQTKRRKI